MKNKIFKALEPFLDFFFVLVFIFLLSNQKLSFIFVFSSPVLLFSNYLQKLDILSILILISILNYFVVNIITGYFFKRTFTSSILYWITMPEESRYIFLREIIKLICLGAFYFSYLLPKTEYNVDITFFEQLCNLLPNLLLTIYVLINYLVLIFTKFNFSLLDWSTKLIFMNKKNPTL
jgi:hypothetical protein